MIIQCTKRPVGPTCEIEQTKPLPRGIKVIKRSEIRETGENPETVISSQSNRLVGTTMGFDAERIIAGLKRTLGPRLAAVRILGGDNEQTM